VIEQVQKKDEAIPHLPFCWGLAEISQANWAGLTAIKR